MRKLGRPIVDQVFEQSLRDAEMPVSNRVRENMAREIEKVHLQRKVGFYRMVAAASVLLVLGMGTWMLATQLMPVLATGSVRAHARIVHPNLPAFANRNCTSAELSGTLYAALTTLAPRHSDKGSRIHQWLQVREEMHGHAPKGSVQVSSPIHLAEEMRAISITRMETKRPALLPQSDRRGFRDQVPTPAPANEGILSKIRKPDREREFTYAANEPDEDGSGRQGHWEMGAGFSPDMSFSSTTPVQRGAKSTQPLADDPTQANTNRLSPVVAYAAGFNTSYHFSDRLSVRAGLTCMNRQTSTAAPKETFGKNGNTFQSNLDLVSMEVPVTVRYNVLHSDNYDYYVASGMSGNFFLHYNNYLQASDGSIVGRRSSDMGDAFKPSQASVLLSTGLRYRLFKDLSLQVEPGMRYGLWTNAYAFSREKPVSMSLMSGMTYRF